MASTRQAWLVLKGAKLMLDDRDAGYAMTVLDISYPEVRDVTNNRPIQHGIDDQTAFFGGRTVTAEISAWPNAGVALDDIPALFAPYMDPAARPELHWTIISDEARERVLTLRAAGMAAPMPSPGKRQIQLSWIAADPVIRDAEVKTARALSGSPQPIGRKYNLIYNRTYPAGSAAPSTGVLVSNGDFPVPPRLRLWGPITAPYIEMDSSTGSGSPIVTSIRFVPSFSVSPNHYVDIDCLNHTAWLDGNPKQSVINRLNFGGTVWPVIQPAPYTNYLIVTGDSTGFNTQVEAAWQDLYLT